MNSNKQPYGGVCSWLENLFFNGVQKKEILIFIFPLLWKIYIGYKFMTGNWGACLWGMSCFFTIEVIVKIGLKYLILLPFDFSKNT